LAVIANTLWWIGQNTVSTFPERKIKMSPAEFVIRFIAVIFTVLICNSAIADHQWGNYKWKTSGGQLALDLIDNVGPDWDLRLEEAGYDWTQWTWDNGASLQTVVNLIVKPGTYPSSCGPVSNIVQVCNAAYGDNGWLGIAQIWLSRGRQSAIVAGVAKMNDTYFNSSAPGTGYNTVPWRQLVMCQEIAHTFGLDHQDENFSNDNLGTCMDYTNDPAGNEHPNQHDYEQLTAMYGDSGDSTDGGSTKACNPNSPKCKQGVVLENPSDWGRLVSGHGAKEVYERDLGNGYKMLTHVTWTLEHVEAHDRH
jgi:hypothetical protein